MKGDVQSVAMAIVVTVVVLFVGIFMITQVADVTPESSLKVYGYTTVTNSTDSGWINTTNNGTQSLVIGTLVSIEGETPTKTLKITAENTDTTNRTFTVYLNDVSLGTLLAVKSTNTTKTFTEVSWVTDSVNNLTYGNTINVDEDLSVTEAVGIYPSSKADSDMGSVQTSLVASTSVIYNILILVLIIVGLAVAIGYLSGFGGKTSNQASI